MNFQARVEAQLERTSPYYEPPEGTYRRYDQNVNLLGPHPAVRTQLDLSRAHLYPSRDNQPLLDAIARRIGVPWERIWAGNGSDEILDLALRVLVEPGGRVAVPSPSYSMYARLAQLNRLTFVPVPTDEAFQPDVDGVLEARPDLVLLCNPNNPTGTVTPTPTIARLLEAFEGPVVIDEAYGEFAGVDALKENPERPNLIVVRTLSKAYGLAGLRIGYGVAAPPVAELIRRRRAPFAVGVPAEQIGVRALADPSPVEACVRVVTRERERLSRGLTTSGFDVVPSGANFVLARAPMDPAALQARLRENGILVRRYPQEPRLAAFVRFTVGGPADTESLLGALATVLEGKAVAA